MSDKQAAFVREYLVDLNATQAAIRAGYSEATASQQGARLLANVKIAEAIRAAMDERAERVQIQSDDVLAELRALVRSNVKHFVIDDSGDVDLADGAPDDAFRAVASIKHKIRTDADKSVTREVELKLWDKNSAIDKAMRHLGIFKDKLDLTSDSKPLRFTLALGDLTVHDGNG